MYGNDGEKGSPMGFSLPKWARRFVDRFDGAYELRASQPQALAVLEAVMRDGEELL
jgi:hypothetical protein